VLAEPVFLIHWNSHIFWKCIVGWIYYSVRVIITREIACIVLYSVETTYGINSLISKQMTIVENAETGQFVFLIMLILSCLTCSWRHPFLSYDVITISLKCHLPPFSSFSNRPSYHLNDEWKKFGNLHNNSSEKMTICTSKI
jgi:hypothetical protein